jgi:Ca2+/Na+ antiporter
VWAQQCAQGDDEDLKPLTTWPLMFWFSIMRFFLLCILVIYGSDLFEKQVAFAASGYYLISSLTNRNHDIISSSNMARMVSLEVPAAGLLIVSFFTPVMFLI